MLTSMYFSCRITKMSKEEELEIRRLYKALLLNKLDFSVTFPYVCVERNIRFRVILTKNNNSDVWVKIIFYNKMLRTNAVKMINALDE